MTPGLASDYAASILDRLAVPGGRVIDKESLLRDLSSRNLDLGEVLRGVVDEITDELNADRGTLFLVDHARGELVSRVARLPEMAEIRLKIGQGVAGWVARTGELVNVPEGTRHPNFNPGVDRVTGYRTESLLAAPVARGGAVVGVLQVLNKRSGRFSLLDEDTLTDRAELLAELLAASSLAPQLSPDANQSISFHFNHVIGSSPVMRAVYERTWRAAATEATVLVRGESGAGKELITRAIHDNSGRRDGPFVKVDCAALPAGLIENELFGHVRGAFTGADAESAGKVAAAQGGTLFLDEVGELPLDVQGKLLRLLQDRVFMKVGGSRPVKANVRFVCATHRELEREVAAGSFRRDLYYRLRVVEIAVPPLRDRGHSDLDRLVDHFLYKFARRHGRPGAKLTREARARLHAHDWPGNVRELEHCVEAAVVLSPSAEIPASALPLEPGGVAAPAAAPGEELFHTPVRTLREVERAYIRYVVALCDDNRSAAARVLGIGRNTLLRKLREG